MAYVPHLFLTGPWAEDRLEISDGQRHHLDNVLRLDPGDQVSYTDGEGSIGSGSYLAGVVTRGKESLVPRPTDLMVVIAPPDNRDRARFLVEKLAELGVAKLCFLHTRHGQGRPPKVERLRFWAVAGLEQSRGAWLMKTTEGLVTFSDLQPPFAVCDRGGTREKPSARTVVIGPEGGWAPGEVPEQAIRFDLGDTVLRLETAALVAAARLA
ncbi:MAG: RsmE family RNA methyltransferase [Acidimicrobiia bacterium]